jgi:hypothetical protein
MDNRLMLVVAAIVLVVIAYALYSGRFPAPAATAPPAATPTAPATPPPAKSP